MKAVLFVLALIALVAVAAASKERYQYYSDLVAEVNSKQNLWEAELNPQFVDADYTTIKNLFGDLSVGSESTLPVKSSGWKTAVEDLPVNFRAVEGFPQCATVMNAVHDQSACGSCWAVATAAAAAERKCVQTGRDGIFLSSRDLLSCCSGCGFGCNGGWPSAAWDFIKTKGLVTGHHDIQNTTQCVRYPFLRCKHHSPGEPQCSEYDFNTPECQMSCDKESTWRIPYDQDKIRFSSSYSLYSEADVMRDLVEHGPMTFSYTVYEDFLAYKSGIYKYQSGKRLGGHAVVLVGYGEEQVDGKTVKYWLAKNNWDTAWGENGYFKIVRGDCSPGFTAGLP